MSKIHETYIIKKWPCSYYDNALHRWLYGNLCIMAKGVRYAGNDGETVDILYSDIVQARKTMTGLIFRAVVLDTRNNEKHWFSSLPDVHTVVQFIDFFLKSKLLQKKGSNSAGMIKMEERTEMGRKLLSVASDSEKTLRDAAELLTTQGHQLDSAMATMMDLHSDLDVTENLVSGLESWFSGWSLPAEYKTHDPFVIHQSDLSQEIDYEVLYTKLEPHKMNAQHLGIFRVAQDGIYLMTDRQKLVHCYKWDGISRVRVVSLWEITVTRFRIGETDVSYSLVFTSVYSVLGILDRRLRSKVEYSQDAFRGESSNQKPLNRTSGSSHSKELFQKKNERPDQVLPSIRMAQSSYHLASNTESNSSRQQMDQSQKVSLQSPQKTVSDREVSELSSILGDLKSLALGVEQEMAEQDEKIGKLGRTVEEANVRVTTTEKRIKKLL